MRSVMFSQIHMFTHKERKQKHDLKASDAAIELKVLGMYLQYITQNKCYQHF